MSFQEEINKIALKKDKVKEKMVEAVESLRSIVKDLRERGFEFKEFPIDYYDFTDKQNEEIMKEAACESDLWDASYTARNMYTKIALAKLYEKIIPCKIYRLNIMSRRNSSVFNQCRHDWEVIEQVVIEHKKIYDYDWEVIKIDNVLFDKAVFGSLEFAKEKGRNQLINCSNFQRELIQEAQADLYTMESQIDNLMVIENVF